MRTCRGALIWLLACAPASAETDFSNLTPAERAIFHEEIRQVLLELPQILLNRPAPDPTTAYADEVAGDLALISAHSGALFDPALPGFGAPDAALRVALFIRPDCPDCSRAEAELRQLAQRFDLRVSLLDMAVRPGLAATLGLDMAPSYVLPDKMLRGHMPMIVLERYFTP